MTDWKWHIFVSHSSAGRDDSVAGQLRDRLKNELNPQHYEVEVDKRFIAAGDRWEEEIRRALRRAHLGIVLLDHHAIKSIWVRRETDILWYKGEFLIPVLIDLRPEDLQGNEDFRLLNERQQIMVSSQDLAAVEEGVRQISDRLAPLAQDYPPLLLQWIRRVTEYLPDLSERTELKEFFSPNGQHGGKAPFHAKEWLAWFMLEAQINEDVVDLIRNLRDHLIKVEKDGREEFLTLLEPTWIDPDHASAVVPETKPERLFMTLEAIHVQTAEQYVRRGTQWDDRWYKIYRPDPVPDAEGRPYWPDDLEESVRHLLDSDPDFTEPIDYNPDCMYYLVLRADADDLKRVRKLCEKVTVVLQCDTSTDDDWTALGGHRIRLESVDPDVERQVLRRIRAIRKVLRCERNTGVA